MKLEVEIEIERLRVKDMGRKRDCVVSRILIVD